MKVSVKVGGRVRLRVRVKGGLGLLLRGGDESEGESEGCVK